MIKPVAGWHHKGIHLNLVPKGCQKGISLSLASQRHHEGIHLTLVSQWQHKGVCLVIVITFMLGAVVEVPDDPHGDSQLLHPVPKGMEVFLLPMDGKCLKAEEHLINIKKQMTS